MSEATMPNVGNDTAPEEELEKNLPDSSNLGNDEQPNGNPPEQPKSVDYREKFAFSTREAQILLAEKQELERRLGKHTSVENPTEEELHAAYPDWDVMTPTERSIANNNLILTRQVAELRNLSSDLGQKLSWNENFNEVLNRRGTDGKLVFPGLRERREEFEHFCKSHPLITDFNVLAQSFLFEVKDELPKAPKTTAPANALERGGGGGTLPASPSGNVLSDDDAERLRKSDPKAYNELVRKGKLK